MKTSGAEIITRCLERFGFARLRASRMVRYCHPTTRSTPVRFAAIAEGFGIIGVNAGKSVLLTRTLEAALALPGPVLVEVPISPDEAVLAGGRA